MIDNCSLTEADTEQLMAGFAQLEVLRSLVIRRSEIGAGTIPHLASCMSKMFPSNLAVLKIEKCRVSKEATFDIIRALQGKCYIKTLALVSVSFGEESIDELCRLLSRKK